MEENSLDSFADDSLSTSEELDVIQMHEDVKYFNMVNIGNLSRIGMRKPMWNNQWNSYFIMFAFLLNYDSLIVFTHNLDDYGIHFLGAYLLTTFTIGFPIMYMEFALGQYTSSNAVAVFDRIASAFAGVGLAIVLLNLTAMLSDQVIMSQFLAVVWESSNFLTNEMQWHNCATQHNDKRCRVENWCTRKGVQNNKGLSQQHAVKYESVIGTCVPKDSVKYTGFSRPRDFPERIATYPVGQHLLGEVDISTLSIPNWLSVESLIWIIVSWMLILLCARMQRHNLVRLAKVAVICLVTVIFSMIVVFIFVLPPPFSFIHALQDELGDVVYNKLIFAAIPMTFRTLRLGQGKFIFVGSQNGFHTNILTDCCVVFLLTSFIPFCYSIIYLLARDSYLMSVSGGNMITYTARLKEFQTTYSGSVRIQSFELPFFSLTVAVYKEYEPVVLCLFSVMGILSTVASKVVELEILFTAVMENSSIFSYQNRRETILETIVAFCSVLFLLFYGSNGYEVIVGLENIAEPFVTYIVVFFELVVVAYVYGARRMIANITAMSTDTKGGGQIDWKRKFFNILLIFLWCLFCPAVIILSICVFLSDDYRARDTMFPFLLSFAIVSVIPGVLVFRVISKLKKKEALGPLFRPDPNFWGPRSRNERERAEKIERQIRNFA